MALLQHDIDANNANISWRKMLEANTVTEADLEVETVDVATRGSRGPDANLSVPLFLNPQSDCCLVIFVHV